MIPIVFIINYESLIRYKWPIRSQWPYHCFIQIVTQQLQPACESEKNANLPEMAVPVPEQALTIETSLRAKRRMAMVPTLCVQSCWTLKPGLLRCRRSCRGGQGLYGEWRIWQEERGRGGGGTWSVVGGGGGVGETVSPSWLSRQDDRWPV